MRCICIPGIAMRIRRNRKHRIYVGVLGERVALFVFLLRQARGSCFGLVVLSAEKFLSMPKSCSRISTFKVNTLSPYRDRTSVKLRTLLCWIQEPPLDVYILLLMSGLLEIKSPGFQFYRADRWRNPLSA
jgi:hypothetical protein